ncbi:PglL family O-oligosaccharyltransferase [Photobacterium sanguinicancri]|uniref:PglL family O-oligosaccharyltransferase n=1 Tax=Photobacterium sanguinicancri TaxID=875932 RepID=UPI0026E19150|nr:Wzy polymerase domain-containing protein [Photobacterium sanguinicancri]MDO6499790.1 Wzy polymerase domain-containing protein [Photobacterium sanguinicancri]
MTVLHIQGTRLAQPGISKPLVKPFLAALCALFVHALLYFQHNPGGSGLELPFNATSWMPFSFAIGVGLLEISRQRIWRYTRLTIVLFICCILLSIPMLYGNADIAAVSDRIIGLWAGFLFFVALQQFAFTPSRRQLILWFILLGILTQTLFGWYQYLWIEPNNAFGFDPTLSRPHGIFQQPNVMASFLATGLVLSGYLLARMPMYRGKWSFQQLLLLITPVLIIPILIVLSSRTGWLGAIVGVALLIPYLKQFAAKAQWRMWLLMIVLGLTTSYAINQSTDWSAQEDRVSLKSPRSIHIPQSFKMFTTEPLTGYGYGTFEVSYLAQTARWHHADPSQPAGLPALDHPHNELTFWAAEGGIVPLIALLIAAAAVIFKIKKARDGTQLALVALFFPITLHTQLEYPFYHSLVHWVIFIILIYWVDNLTAKYHKKGLNYVLGIKVSALLIPLLVSSYMITTLYSGRMLTKFETTLPLNIDYLMKVNNPWAWKHRYEWALHQPQLELAQTLNKPKLIEEYIRWATVKAKTWPREQLYGNLILSYRLLGDNAHAEQIYQEAKFLFPEGDFSDALAVQSLSELSAVTSAAKPAVE